MDLNSVFNISPSNIPFEETNQKKNDQWRKVLGTFDLIEDIKEKTPDNNRIKSRNRASSCKKQTLHRRKQKKYLSRKACTRRSILSSSFTNTFHKTNNSEQNLDESEIVWSSSNEESDQFLGTSKYNKRLRSQRLETEIKCSSSESEKDCNNSSSQQTDSYRGRKKSSCKKLILRRLKAPKLKYPTRKVNIQRFQKSNDSQENLDDSEIVWSSSNEEESDLFFKKRFKNNRSETDINWSSSETENSCNLTSQQVRVCTPQPIDSNRDLDLFIEEIEKDLRRTKAIKQKITSKNEGYVNSFYKAINKAKADTSFLDYEHKSEIVVGLKGLIAERQVVYGSCFANVDFGTGSYQCIFLDKSLQTNDNVGKSVVCLFDESSSYEVNDKTVFIQPNKVIGE